MNAVYVSAVLLAVTIGSHASLTNRDAEKPGIESWKEKVSRIIQLSEKGIDANNLKALSLDLAESVEAELANKGSKVSIDEAKAIIMELIELTGDISLEELLAAPVTIDASKISMAFKLLRKLLEKETALEAEDKSTTGVLSAISLISRAIASGVDELVLHLGRNHGIERRIAASDGPVIIIIVT
ncbi:uncharacterized protein LOC131946549 [Physella acuta]|uniref:uncharacterized protein LOC131946549 n=1 Tax=Physella acuta TaxID=109671 RepID=UPI0027DDBAAA|nr:uncharacterized protein LOC131946549 [Physella acuta]